ncbi:MAG TPA: PhoX family phosphatase [Noviherbaspirillum sp.]|uniref:PhoX family protein n=1 Tax=Noviherbaspirillum sp. TaxID=1926288 RepID=UPI002D38C029|nr:PhoX family phosphatase [Noviherbaspirillum sp.]HYD96957.1 PhoX family phosphatase [Noviherbaspirillum sp.]
MNDFTRHDLLTDPEDVGTNDSANPSFESVLNARLSRRSLLKGTFGAATTVFFGGSLAACGGTGNAVASAGAVESKTLKLSFNAVAKSVADAVTVPAGYTASVLYRLGDPIAAAVPDYRNDGTDSGASFAQRAGDHHDGMHFFGLGADGKYSPSASDRGLLVMNHEAITPAYLHKNGVTIDGAALSRYPSAITNTMTRTVADEVIKELNAHGVSIIEVRRDGNRISYRRDSAYNRRITTFTEMTMSGPAARTPYMVTAYSPDGSKTRGTVNNCANGYTPWGTYLTCEENWAGYFRRIAATDNPNRSAKELASFARYGVAGTGRELWATAAAAAAGDTSFSRWNAMKTGSSADGSDDFRNVANTFGWVVEIDPFNPASTPKKRTALGRFAHEGAWPGPVVPGKPLVWYMGCDSRNEYIYKYVSNKAWDPSDANKGMAAGDKYLDDGRLYVAKFNADGSGQWLELQFGSNGITGANAAYPFADQADVLVNTRLAADAAGATKMDRPEWGAVNPANGEVYMTLTNNNSSNRTLANADAANPRFYNDPKGSAGTAQKGNPNGHIIRWAENDGNVAATGFKWDVFLFGARATADAASINVSNLTSANDFSSPDGLWFSQSTGLLWIQTDDGAYTDVTNCMLLAAVAGKVGDGTRKTITNVDGSNSRSVDTYVGAALGETNLRRFLVGPKECEITGIAETPDGKALFVNIQHPGEDSAPDFNNPGSFGSHWPDGGNARPRSATIVITKDDGGTVGGGLS